MCLITHFFYILHKKTLSALCSLLCCPLQICWLVMSGERLPKDFSSTPLKDFQPSKGFGDGILSDEEDTFSLLSPIYHDSFDSDEEELRSIPDQQTTSPRERDDSRLSISPLRCCRKALDRVLACLQHDSFYICVYFIGVNYQKRFRSNLQLHLPSVRGKCGW